MGRGVIRLASCVRLVGIVPAVVVVVVHWSVIVDGASGPSLLILGVLRWTSCFWWCWVSSGRSNLEIKR